jgi:hypothetical protein
MLRSLRGCAGGAPLIFLVRRTLRERIFSVRFRAHIWDAARLGTLGEESLRARFHPPSHYRVSAHTYPPAEQISGSARAGTIFGIAGRCELVVGPWSAEIGAGEFVSFPAGEYVLRVVGDVPCTVIQVWDILLITSAAS